jgi:hypothetical protein
MRAQRQPRFSKRQTAYHEAGHALVAMAFGIPITSITIVPDPEGRYAGLTVRETYVEDIDDRVAWAFPEEEDDAAHEAWCLAYHRGHTLLTVGGYAAEIVVWGAYRADPAEGDDLDDIEVLREFVRVAGPKIDLLPSVVGVDENYDEPFKAALAEAVAVVQQHRPALDALARALLRRQTLTGEEAVAIADRADPTLQAAQRLAAYREVRERAQRRQAPRNEA